MNYAKNTVFSIMKKGKINTIISENVDKNYLTNMNEDSYFDGHKFVDYGKNIQNISLMMPSTDLEDFSIDKDKLSISWGVKFNFINSGIEGVQVEVLDINANIITSGEGESRKIPINFGEYKIEVVKEKNVESKEFQMFVSSIDIDVEQKTVNVIISI